MQPIDAFYGEEKKYLHAISKTGRVQIWKDYDPTYEYLTKNWEDMREKLGALKRLIILTEKDMDPKVCTDAEAVAAARELTMKGFRVRCMDSYKSCAANCGNIIVTKPMYNRIRKTFQKRCEAPPAEFQRYSQYCSVCRQGLSDSDG